MESTKQIVEARETSIEIIEAILEKCGTEKWDDNCQRVWENGNSDGSVVRRAFEISKENELDWGEMGFKR